MKKLLVLIFFTPGLLLAQADSWLSLQKAYDLALQNYPMVKQRDLIKQTTGINLDNLAKGFLPQFNLGAQASWQSDVTQIKIPVPGVNITPPGKDQYRLFADVNQLLYDGGVIKEQKNLQQLNQRVEDEKVTVELYKIKERINQLFLGVLFLDEQLNQVKLVKDDLNAGLKKVTAQVDNGVAFRSNLNLLNAEILKTAQREIEINATRNGLLNVLGLFINQHILPGTKLQKPVLAAAPSVEIVRPEIKLFSAQQQMIWGQQKLIDAKNSPKAALFLQGGYGRPGLNFLNNNFAFFCTTGVKVNWNFGGLYTQKKEKQQLLINQKSIEVQKETFLFNTNTQLIQQQAEIDKLLLLIATDIDIIDLRVKVKDAARSQLENGVITANDYLREVNAEDQSRQAMITHQVQLLQARINYQTISGKQ